MRGLTIASLLKAMVGIAVAGQDGDFVTSILETDGGVDDETLSTADAQVRVDEDDVPLGLGLFCHSRCRVMDWGREEYQEP